MIDLGQDEATAAGQVQLACLNTGFFYGGQSQQKHSQTLRGCQWNYFTAQLCMAHRRYSGTGSAGCRGTAWSLYLCLRAAYLPKSDTCICQMLKMCEYPLIYVSLQWPIMVWTSSW